MEKDEDRLSILEKVERGEISIEDAEAQLGEVAEDIADIISPAEETDLTMEEEPGKAEDAILQMEEEPVVEEKPAKVEGVVGKVEAEKTPGVETGYAPTKRERRFAMAKRYQDWDPLRMIGLAPEDTNGSWQWPWEDKAWQWTWQNFGSPVYISHSIDLDEGGELKLVSYQGDVFIRGWDEPTLKINGAALDIRIGQDENTIRVASTTGQLQIWIPTGLARVEAMAMPGDVWLSNISSNIDVHCQSGDLGCQRVKGNIQAHVDGGDARLMGIEGSLDVKVVRGNTDVRDISSDNVNLRATEGSIWLSLSSVNSGTFRCENDGGDVNLLTQGELVCELLLEATEGGMLSPVMLPWQRLLERSSSKLHGILGGGGASISLITRGGRIYVQEPWVDTFPVPSPS